MFDRREKKIILALFLVNFCMIMDFMIIMPLGPIIMRVLEISPKQFSSLVTAYTLGAAVAGFLTFFLFRNNQRKHQLLKFLLGFVIVSFLSFLCTSYHLFLISRLITGLFVGFIGVVQLSIISEFIDLKKRSTALGVVMAAFAVASIIGVPIGVTIGNKVSWSAPFLFVFAVSATVWVSVFKLLPELTGATSESKDGRFQVLSEFAASKSGWALIGTLIFSNFLIVPFLFPSIILNGKVSESQLPMIYLVGGVSAIFSSVIFGRLADRYGNKKIFSIGVVSSVVAMYFATNIYPLPLGVIILIVAFYFAATSGRIVPAMTLVTSAVRLPIRGQYMSFVTCLQHLAAGLASVVAGAIAVKLENEEILNLPKLGYLAMSISLISLYFAWKVPQYSSSNDGV
ncbi:MAG: MFS transporter [Bdellovibrionales bacterium]|nr:MFS transporter [Bdellovibrionales bacterium]